MGNRKLSRRTQAAIESSGWVRESLCNRLNTYWEHLCYLISQGFHINKPEEFEAIVRNPEFKCQHCGRVAKNAENVCEPVKL